MNTTPSTPERRLHEHVEPVAQLGFAAYGHRRGCDEVTQMEWYFGGRLACLGAVSGAAAVALLAVLPPDRVTEGVAATWAKIEPDALIACRLDAIDRWLSPLAPAGVDSVDGVDGFDAAATNALLRTAIDALEPAGHPLFAGWRARDTGRDDLAAVWLRTVALREHRGAAHISAWRAQGLTPTEILVLTEAAAETTTRAAIGSHATTAMGWPPEVVRRAVASLGERGWLDADAITPAGRAARAEIESATDRQETPAVLALGADLDVLCRQLALLTASVR